MPRIKGLIHNTIMGFLSRTGAEIKASARSRAKATASRTAVASAERCRASARKITSELVPTVPARAEARVYHRGRSLATAAIFNL